MTSVNSVAKAIFGSVDELQTFNLCVWRKPATWLPCDHVSWAIHIEPGFLWESNSSSFSRETRVFCVHCRFYKEPPQVATLSHKNDSSLYYLISLKSVHLHAYEVSRSVRFSLTIWFVLLIYSHAPSIHFFTASCRHFSYYGDGFLKHEFR